MLGADDVIQQRIIGFYVYKQSRLSAYRLRETSGTATTGFGETFSWGPRAFLRGPSGENFFEFFFQNGTFWRTLYFWPTAGPPNVAGPEVVYPYPTLSMGLNAWTRVVLLQDALLFYCTLYTIAQVAGSLLSRVTWAFLKLLVSLVSLDVLSFHLKHF